VDAILVDIMMPDIDGYETIGEIRNMSRSKSTPIIVVTAKAMKDDRERCIAAGATDYISKPADVDRLLSLLRLHLGN
jgi:CheY-like chemotaxis protein